MQSVNCYLLILIDLNRLLILIILKELTALLFTNPLTFFIFLVNIALVMGQGKCRLMVVGLFLLIFED